MGTRDVRQSGRGVQVSQLLCSDDLCYFMLEEGLRNLPKVLERKARSAHSNTCYICRDPEFALMGLPLCTPCPKCHGHVAADDTCCDDCGFDTYKAYCEAQALAQNVVRACKTCDGLGVIASDEPYMQMASSPCPHCSK